MFILKTMTKLINTFSVDRILCLSMLKKVAHCLKCLFGICCWIFEGWERKGSRGDFILYVGVLVTHNIFNHDSILQRA
jgi:hypothetical protein